MGETTCLTRPFSYAAGISHQENEMRNPVHSLGDSVSFGRFLLEPLAWERWSSFSHSKYVEEAEKFSRPGSVAQMKAFFEAHYKNLAAKKAAEAANAAVEAAEESKNSSPLFDVMEVGNDMQICEMANQVMSKVEVVNDDTMNRLDERDVVLDDTREVESLTQSLMEAEKDEEEGVDLNSEKQLEKPLLKGCNSTRREYPVEKKQMVSTPSKTPQSASGRGSKVSSSPAKLSALLRNNSTPPVNKKLPIEPRSVEKKRKQTPGSSRKAMNFTPVKEINRITSSIIRKLENSRGCSGGRVSQSCITPLKTIKEEDSKSFATPQSVKGGCDTTPLSSSTSGMKNSRARWNFLPTDCSKFMSSRGNRTVLSVVSSPISLKTEERAAKRKEKLEEKFNTDQSRKMQLQATIKEKAEAELKKLRRSLCFKARPLPDFYRERGRKDPTESPLTKHPPSPQSGNINKCSGKNGDDRNGTVIKPENIKSPQQFPLPERHCPASTRNLNKIGSNGLKDKQDKTLHSSKLDETRENTSPNILPLPAT